MTDLPTMIARKEGRAGRLTFNRPKALNALDHDMAVVIEQALDQWRDDPEVALVIIDAVGDRAFCAGGDIAIIYQQGRAGDFETGPRFWRDEYRMNAKVAEFPKPIVSFMQGFVMGGGVGVGGHCSHRVVGDSTQIAMPETGIGLIPDVGGTLILARAPGRVGEYLGVTGGRFGAADAIYAGFADVYAPEAEWDALKARLIETGDVGALPSGLVPQAKGRLADLRPEIEAAFGGHDIHEIVASLEASGSDFGRETLAILRRNSALSEEATLQLVRMTRATPTIRAALENEFRFTLRAVEHSDFLEGVRAQIIDKDRNPQWKYSLETLPMAAVSALLEPLPKGYEIDFAA
ncbi:enoyl-CoA hydratase/isomerase family protein [Sedimentimonas flavescens]|uniref:enoyl-CoA hydratase/isomerase family protein n=1 Tax=Sedimentimonas flavescens TaxID=2851012 RepID=UPI0021A92382|nr:enoyl-CoA hydratase/isomerase family protein [Sedimentimonas flavescens]MCT2540722.1 3-hydroxyisobutyryl-CoA hydrolase [Sedimentimonas flavescens]